MAEKNLANSPQSIISSLKITKKIKTKLLRLISVSRRLQAKVKAVKVRQTGPTQ